MIVVRNEQLAALERKAWRLAEDRVVAFIAAEYPNRYEEMEEAGARQLAEHAVEFGRARGIDTVGSFFALAGLMIQYGEAFERSPDRDWAHGILGHATLPGQLKVEMLLERMAGRSQGRIIVEQGSD